MPRGDWQNLADGPRRTFFESLHDQWRKAGAPSGRQLGRATSLSPAAANNLINGEYLPRWDTVELVIGYLGGDMAEFQDHWFNAREATAGRGPRPDRSRDDEVHRLQEMIDNAAFPAAEQDRASTGGRQPHRRRGGIVKVVDQVSDGHLHEAAWDLYFPAFSEMDGSAANRLMLHRSEFDELFHDFRVAKYLCLDEAGELTGFSVLTNDLFAFDEVSPSYFRRRWQTLYEERRIWLSNLTIAIDHESYATLFEVISMTVAAIEGILGIDGSRLTAEGTRCWQNATVGLRKLNPGKLDEQLRERPYVLYGTQA